MKHIFLTGFMGTGKTTISGSLKELLHMDVIDMDQAIEDMEQMPIPEIFAQMGETYFRLCETGFLRKLKEIEGAIISCGGGVVTRDENYPLLHQNSRIVMLNRPIGELSRKGRPITARDGVEKLAAERMPRYRAWADIVIDSRENAEATARALFK